MFNECVIECLSTGSTINLNCVGLYTVCLVENRSVLGYIEACIIALKDVPRIAKRGLLCVK